MRFAHAVETAVTKAQSFCTGFLSEAFRLTMAGLPRVLESTGGLAATRALMLLGAPGEARDCKTAMLERLNSAANPPLDGRSASPMATRRLMLHTL